MRRRKRNKDRARPTEQQWKGWAREADRRGEEGCLHPRQEENVRKLPLPSSPLPSSPPSPHSWSYKEPLKLSDNPLLFR